MDAARYDPIYAPTLLIATIAVLITSVTTVLVRLAIRWPWSQELRGDDVSTLLAGFVAVIQSSIVFTAVHHGLGDANPRLHKKDMHVVEKCLFAGDILFLLSLAISRVAACRLISRLSNTNSVVIAARAVMVLIVIVCVVSLLAIGLRPGIIDGWDILHSSNIVLSSVWLVVDFFGVGLEVALLILPTVLVWAFPLTVWDKICALSGFFLRSPLIPMSIAHAITMHEALHHVASDLPSKMGLPTIISQVEMHWAVIACTIPLFNMFYSRIAGNIPALEEREKIERYVAAPSPVSYRMNNISRPQPMTTSKRPDLDIEDMEISVASNPAYYDSANSYSTGAPKREDSEKDGFRSPGPSNRDYTHTRRAPFAPGTAI